MKIVDYHYKELEVGMLYRRDTKNGSLYMCLEVAKTHIELLRLNAGRKTDSFPITKVSSYNYSRTY